MVYETDFYTSRRPYSSSSSRPTISSYSITTPYRIYPGVSTRVYSYTTPSFKTYSIPYVAHKRISTGSRVLSSPIRYVSRSSPVRVISSPARYVSSRLSPMRILSSPPHIVSVSVRPSVLNREIRRIESLYRPLIQTSAANQFLYSPEVLNIIEYSPWKLHLPECLDIASWTYQPTMTHTFRNHPCPFVSKHTMSNYHVENETPYIANETYKQFDDETRDIRSSTIRLMKKIQAPVVRRSRSVTPFAPSRFEYDNFKTSLGSDANESYYNYLSRPTKSVRAEIESMSHWAAPAKKYVGQSHIACVRIVGDRGYPTRKSRVDELRDDKVRKDVNLMSYYLKNRRAASELESVRKIDRNANQTPASG